MTKKNVFRMRGFLIINLAVSLSIAMYQICINKDDKMFWFQYIVVISCFSGIAWNSMKIKNEKKGPLYWNVLFLMCNIMAVLVTVFGNDSPLAPIIVIVGSILIAGIFMMLLIHYKKQQKNK